MKKTSLIEILSDFSPEEIKEFSKYIRSEFFNKNQSVIKLYNYIKKFHPGYNSSKLEKEYVFKKIFKPVKYDDGYMRLVIYKLQKLAEEYLAYINYRNDDRRVLFHLIEELFSKNNNKLIDKKIKEAGKYIVNTGYEIPVDFFYKFNFEFHKNCRRSEKFVQHKTHIPGENIYKEPEYLISFFILRLLANHMYHLNQSMQINYKPKLLFLDEIINYLNNNPHYFKSIFINLKFHGVLLLKEKKDTYFYKLRDILFKEIKNLASEDIYNTISILINYCREKYLETCSKKYMEEQFKILRFALDNGQYSFRKKGYFDFSRFKSYVTLAIEFNEIEWAKDFIKKYKNKLNPQFKDNYVSLCLSYIEFSQGSFDDTIKHLSTITQQSEAALKLNVKDQYLKTYYEMDLIEQAISLSDSFRHFISSTKELPDATKQSYKNYLLKYNNMISLKSKFDEYKLKRLSEDVNTSFKLVNKDWLLKKLEDLKIYS